MKRVWLKAMLASSLLFILILLYYNHTEVETISKMKSELERRTEMSERNDQKPLEVKIEEPIKLEPPPEEPIKFEPPPEEPIKFEPPPEEPKVVSQNETIDFPQSDTIEVEEETTQPTTTTATTTTTTTTNTPEEPATCTPKIKKNMVYLKTHKTASSAVQNIIMRKALKDKLRILQPRNSHDFGYPSKFRLNSVAVVKKPNLLCHHTRFNYEIMKTIMPDDSVWVASVREPLSLYKSSIAYFRPLVPAFQRIKVDDPIELWFDQAAKFTSSSKFTRFNHFTKNHMFFDFGYDNKNENDVYINEAIRQLDEIFDLVLIADYFDESMVLLSDLLCWPIQDFACLTLNAQKKSSKNLSEADVERTRQKVRNWNRADSKLFDHFNATLWRKIEEYGIDRMEQQLELLHQETEKLSDECLETSNPVDISSLKSSAQRNGFYQPKGVKITGYQLKLGASMQCKHLVAAENAFSQELFKYQNARMKRTV